MLCIVQRGSPSDRDRRSRTFATKTRGPPSGASIFHNGRKLSESQLLDQTISMASSDSLLLPSPKRPNLGGKLGWEPEKYEVRAPPPSPNKGLA